ncbi:serine--tRNA ligase [Waddlia chondrophila]|uniref:Serine--tRNA ligase n=1 Tax=Waddlia chondrophila (strain ATCC VR-1470 / WSU 86-1044) TaxID=716544 RepID=D6YSD0_WADCW|nr:serine--tRNA ligase [Waddlia chondrophila]ADI38975.1 Seryl-tRNA synthetase [Waddlia chondrophila WSU 86-1044]
MIDIKLIRANREEIEEKLKRKEPGISLFPILELDQKIRGLKTKVEQLKSERNHVSKKIGEMKRKGEDSSAMMSEVSGKSAEIHAIDHELGPLEEKFRLELAKLPNLPMDDIKIHDDPAENVMIKEFGEKREFDFPFKNHVELNEQLKLFDFVRGAKIAGSGWPIYRGWGARLEWALLHYMMSVNIKNGFTQWMPPALVRPEVMFGSGQLPKFANQQFAIHDEEYNLFLIPTAEVPLNGLHADEILEEEELPLKYCAYTPCFRREAGAAGSNERGLIRTHQFNKVEMFCFCKPEESGKIFDEMIANAEEILEGLGLHYRNMLLVTGDMSFASARTVDIEVWLPGQDRYYEVSSVSNCTDYQSRRSQIRFRRKGEKPELLHTLNGSGLATSRLMVSLIENNQNSDGSINIPTVLQPYLDGKTVLN